jgi:hypothetical protein
MAASISPASSRSAPHRGEALAPVAWRGHRDPQAEKALLGARMDAALGICVRYRRWRRCATQR